MTRGKKQKEIKVEKTVEIAKRKLGENVCLSLCVSAASLLSVSPPLRTEKHATFQNLLLLLPPLKLLIIVHHPIIGPYCHQPHSLYYTKCYFYYTILKSYIYIVVV